MLFCFYLIVLTLMPCGDVADVAAGTITSYSFHKDSAEAETCSQEACAPFCSCNCCSVGNNFPVGAVHQTNNPSIQVAYVWCAVSAPCTSTVDVWQPPKLA